jgi:hypothetical protein
MVMSINANAEKTFDEFLATAKGTLNGTTTASGTTPAATGSTAPSVSATVSGAAASGTSKPAGSGATPTHAMSGVLVAVGAVMALAL